MYLDNSIPSNDFLVLYILDIVSLVSGIISYHITVYHEKQSNIRIQQNAS